MFTTSKESRNKFKTFTINEYTYIYIYECIYVYSLILNVLNFYIYMIIHTLFQSRLIGEALNKTNSVVSEAALYLSKNYDPMIYPSGRNVVINI